MCIRDRDRTGAFHEIDGEELLATACCHEIDHLNGIVFKSHVVRMLDPSEYEVEE